jgi:hypothetical protein
MKKLNTRISMIAVYLLLQITMNAQNSSAQSDIPDTTILDYRTIGLGIFGGVCCFLFLRMEAKRLRESKNN